MNDECRNSNDETKRSMATRFRYSCFVIRISFGNSNFVIRHSQIILTLTLSHEYVGRGDQSARAPLRVTMPPGCRRSRSMKNLRWNRLLLLVILASMAFGGSFSECS